ncbi:hypothetical protein [Bradyrhizobium cenepequi]
MWFKHLLQRKAAFCPWIARRSAAINARATSLQCTINAIPHASLSIGTQNTGYAVWGDETSALSPAMLAAVGSHNPIGNES